MIDRSDGGRFSGPQIASQADCDGYTPGSGLVVTVGVECGYSEPLDSYAKVLPGSACLTD